MNRTAKTLMLPIGQFYLAIIGDISQSRHIADRAAFQQRLHQLMDELNQRWARWISSRFTVTLGDEFQALMKRADPLFALWQQLESALKPYRFVLGVGIGRLETALIPHSSVGMDGPCLRLARQEVEKAKKEPPRLRVAIEGIKSEAINAHLLLLEILQSKQTEKQKHIIHLYEQTGKQQQVAQKLGISQAAVSQSLKAAHYLELKKSKQSLIEFLNQFLPD